MKKIIYIILITFGAYSCDMDTNPTNAVREDIVFENATNAEYVLNGTWAYLMDTYYTYQNPGWSTILLASDAMASDVAVQPNKYGYYAHYSFTNLYSTSSYSAEGIWSLAYKAIDNTNHLITKIDDVSGEESLKKAIKSQAYALRGYLYLNLATFYSHAYQYDPEAKCVPVYIKPTTLETKGEPKSTVAQVYKRAEEDLLEAYKLSEGYVRTAKHRMNKQVIAGVLARLYLQRMNDPDWADAEKYAKIAQEGSEWMTKSEYLIGFNDRSNKEWIWGHGQASDQNTASYSFNYKDVSSESSGYYSFMADPYFKDLFDSNDDVRTELFQWDLVRYKGSLLYKKFLFRTDKTADIVLMRKAEMVLIEAEALAEQTKLADAAIKLNELRVVRGAHNHDFSALSKDDLVEEILKERRKELFGEGFGLSDIKRRQKAVVRKEAPSDWQVPGYTPGPKDDEIYVKGHTIRLLPAEKGQINTFTPNNKYYNISIPAKETINNPNLNK